MNAVPSFILTFCQDMMERVHYLEQFMQELTSRVFNFREDKVGFFIGIFISQYFCD